MHPEIWGKWKDHSTKRERPFTFWCKSYLIILMECIWGGGWAWVTSVLWMPLVLQFHSFIHSCVLTKRLLTTQTNTRAVTEMKTKLCRITTESNSQTHNPRRLWWFLWDVAILRTDPRRQRVCPRALHLLSVWKVFTQFTNLHSNHKNHLMVCR